MRVLIIAGNGFLGSNVKKFLQAEHEVYTTTRASGGGDRTHYVDLEKPNTIRDVLKIVKPEAVISCAGIIDASEDTDRNVTFTENLLKEISAMDKIPKKIIISGSAAEYGYVAIDQIPVNEEVPLGAEKGYGLSKVKEEKVAHDLAKKYSLPVVVARIFNPIGVGMHPRFLISNLLRQLASVNAGMVDSIELSRLDSARDYVSVDDIASAFGAIIEGNPTHAVYNIGSGVSTTNGELLDMLVNSYPIKKNIHIKQTSDIVEPLVAIQADIGRLANDFGWKPQTTLNDTVREIVYEQSR